MPHGVGGDGGDLAGAFLIGLAAADGHGAEAVGFDLQVGALQRHQLGAAAQRGVGDGQQRLVAQIAQAAAGGGEHAGDQRIVQRRRLGLGAAPRAVHPLQRQPDGLGRARARHAARLVDGGDAGHVAPDGRRRLARGHGVDERGHRRRRRWQGLAACRGTPGGEDRHVGLERAHGVGRLGAARVFCVAPQVCRDGGLEARPDGHGLGAWAGHLLRFRRGDLAAEYYA